MCVSAVAGQFEDAMSNFERGNHEAAFQEFLSIAERYEKFVAEPDASSKSRLLQEMGAELLPRVVSSQLMLALMYEQGLGTSKNFKEAAKWYLRAAEEGYVDAAQHRLGILYEEGLGVPQDYTEAAKWFRLAADQGHQEAQFALSRLYYRGRGVPQDYVLSHKWANLAAAQGFRNAGAAREALEKMMTSEQIAEAQRLAREWKPKRQER